MSKYISIEVCISGAQYCHCAFLVNYWKSSDPWTDCQQLIRYISVSSFSISDHWQWIKVKIASGKTCRSEKKLQMTSRMLFIASSFSPKEKKPTTLIENFGLNLWRHVSRKHPQAVSDPHVRQLHACFRAIKPARKPTIKKGRFPLNSQTKSNI